MRPLKGLVVVVSCAASAVVPMAPAEADPPGFPDFSHLPTKEIGVSGPYAVRMHHGSYTAALLSPDRDFFCGFDIYSDSNGFGGFNCYGNIPGADNAPLVDEIQWHPCSRVNLHAGEDSGDIERQEPTCTPDPLPGVVFPSGSKIVYKAVMCGSTGDVLIACINSENEHGFVISRSNTWTF